MEHHLSQSFHTAIGNWQFSQLALLADSHAQRLHDHGGQQPLLQPQHPRRFQPRAAHGAARRAGRHDAYAAGSAVSCQPAFRLRHARRQARTADRFQEHPGVHRRQGDGARGLHRVGRLHVTNTSLTFGQELSILLVLLLTSKGAAGVTGSGFITLAATLSTVGTIPVTGIALLLGIDRFMSEARALTNLIGNGVATVVVAKWEGEFDAVRAGMVLNGTLPLSENPIEEEENLIRRIEVVDS